MMTRLQAGPDSNSEMSVRTGELELLMGEYAAAATGAARMVVIEGPRGSGKSDLIRAFVERVGPGAAVLRGACSREGAALPYGAVAGLLRVGTDSETDSPASVWRQLFAGMSTRLASGPVVLVFDAAQWLDEPSRSWLDLLIQRNRHRALLVVLSQRSSKLPFPRRFVNGANLTSEWRTIVLGALNDNDVCVLASQFWSTPADETFVRRCNTLCTGRPGLLKTLFAHLRETGHGPDLAGAAAAPVVGADLLRTHLALVLDGLPAHVRQVAEAVAVLGRADPEPVALLAGVPEALVPEALRLLEDEGLPGGDSGAPGHSTVLATMAPGERRARHERAARVLNDIGGSAEEIGDHLVQLSTLGEHWMIEALRIAADRSERQGDIARAARLRGRLIATEAATVEDLISYCRVLVQVDAGASHALVADALRRHRDVRVRAALAVQFSRSAVLVRSVPEAVRLLITVLDELIATIGLRPDDDDRRLWTRTELALLSLKWNRVSTVTQINARTRAMGSPAGDSRDERELLAVQAASAALEGRSATEVLTLARRCLREAEAPRNWVFPAAAYALCLGDDVDQGLQALNRFCEHTSEPALALVQVAALTLRAWTLQSVGDLPAAMADAQHAVDLCEIQPGGRIGTPRATLAAILIQQGETGLATELLERLEHGTSGRSVLTRPYLLMTRSAACLAAGDGDGALNHALGCGELLAEAGILNPVFLPWWLEAAPLLVERGRHAQAREVVAHGARLADAWGTATGHGLALLAAGATSTGHTRVKTLRSALRMLAGGGPSWYRVRGELALGDALLEVGESTGARRHYRLGAELAESGGYRVLAESTRDKLRAAGGRAPRPSQAGELTDRERGIAELAARGATNREIAAVLVIALRTVEIHLTSVYRKLKIAGRNELGVALGATWTGATVNHRATTRPGARVNRVMTNERPKVGR